MSLKAPIWQLIEDDNCIVRIDTSEHVKTPSVAGLIGASLVHVGYEDGGHGQRSAASESILVSMVPRMQTARFDRKDIEAL